MKSKAVFLIFFQLALLPYIYAQTPGKILRQAVKALGGKSAVKSIRSWQKKGLIIRVSDGSSGNYLMEAAKPNRFRVKFDLRGFEREKGFNGKSGWQRDSREGLRTLTGSTGEHFKAEVVYRNWRWIDYKKRKEKIRSDGQSNVNGRTCNVIVLTDRRAVSIRLHFDAETNLLLREEIPAGNGVRKFEFADFRPIGGVKEPFQINTEIDGEKFAIRFDQIAHNVEIGEKAFNFPRVLGEPLPDIPSLLKDVQKNEDRVEQLLESYTYTEKVTKRQLGKDGILRVTGGQTFQLSFYKGYRIRRKVAKNGRPLTEKQQLDEDKEVEKRVKKIEKKIARQEKKAAKQARNGQPDEEGQRISIAEVLRASKLLNPRRELLLGRRVIVFDFEPDPDFDFRNAKSILKFFGKTAGVIWIDEDDKQVARLEAVLADSFKIGGGILAKLRKGASFTLEKQRLNDEIWLPSLADINLSVRVLLFGGLRINQIVESSDYRKFETEVLRSRVINKPKDN